MTAYDEAASLMARYSPETLLAALISAGHLTEEWALQYERDDDPTMDNPSGIRTQSSVVANEATAQQAVKNRIPGGSIRNRRVAHRYVTPWAEPQR